MGARAGQYGYTSGQIWILHERPYMGKRIRFIVDRESKIFITILLYKHVIKYDEKSVSSLLL